MLNTFFFPVCFLCESLYFLPFVFQFLSLSSCCLRFWICVRFEVVVIGFKEVKVTVSILALGFGMEWGDFK